jgi:hypothetical protein
VWGPLSRSENQNGGLPAVESRVKHLTDAKRVSAFRNGGGQPRRGESRRHCFFCAVFSLRWFFCPTTNSVRVTRRDPLAKSSLDASHHCTDAAATSQPRSRRPNGGDTGDLTESRPRYATLPPVLTGGTACLRSRANVARPHTHGLHTGTVALTRPPLKNIGSTVRFDAPPRSLMMTDEESDVCVCIRHPLPV